MNTIWVDVLTPRRDSESDEWNGDLAVTLKKQASFSHIAKNQ